MKPWNLKAGDYTVRRDEDGKPVAWVCLPNGTGPCRLKGWELTEHDDDTITLSPSILEITPQGDGWHGYLERGAWREV